MKKNTVTKVAAASLVAVGALAGCSGSEETTASSTNTTAASASETSTDAANDSSADTASESGLVASEVYVKASGDRNMTGVFGTIENTTEETVTLVSGTSESGTVELHEVVDKDGTMTMQQKEGGFVIEPGAKFVLKPGSDHVMLMNIPKPIAVGDKASVELTTDSGQTVTLTGEAREVGSGDEDYHAGH